jgi:hypothetical protein
MKDDDLVTMSEAADGLGMSNQKLHMRRARNENTFPAPKVEGRTARLYSMDELRKWNEQYEKWRNR